MDRRITFFLNCIFILCVLSVQSFFIPSSSFSGMILSKEKAMMNCPCVPKAYGETNSVLPDHDSNITINSSLSDSGKQGVNDNITNTNKDSNRAHNVNLAEIVIDAIYSISRMFISLGISFIVAIILGIVAARKALASKIIIPIIDILQSVPILGFFPVAITFFIALFNGSSIGIELAAIFLIFTSMVWNMIFSVYESVLSIPSGLLETTYAYRANPLLRLRRLYLPASIPKLVYNSILSWAAGWYFLTAAEIISLGSKTYSLSGLGSLLGTSFSSGQYVQAMLALGVLIVIILIIDFYFWRPLESYANRFKYEYSSSSFTSTVPQNPQRYISVLYPQNIRRMIFRSAGIFSSVHLSDFLSKTPRPLVHITSNKLIEISARIIHYFESLIFPHIHRWFDNKTNLKILSALFVPILLVFITIILIQTSPAIFKSISSLYSMYSSIYSDPKSTMIVYQIPLALLLSYLRLTVAYIITLAWTIPVAIKVARSPKFDRIMPIFQTTASIPATAFFPFGVVLVNYVPGGFEFLSILLILTGMQWYVLFNLVGGLRSLPGDIEETSRAFRATKKQYLKQVLFPSMYPSLITGSITAWGGGWNSLIVAEYLVSGDKTYSVLGIGSLLDKASYDVGNTVLLLLIVGVMSLVIVTINRLVWRQIYKKVIRKYSVNI